MRNFILGYLIGAASLFGALSLHVIRSKDGFHVVRKAILSPHDIYVDVREFGFAEWKEHPELSASLVKADKTEIMQGSASDALHRSFDGILGK